MPKTENLAKKENKIKIGVKTPEHTPTLPFNLETKQTRNICHIPLKILSIKFSLYLQEFRIFLFDNYAKNLICYIFFFSSNFSFISNFN